MLYRVMVAILIVYVPLCQLRMCLDMRLETMESSGGSQCWELEQTSCYAFSP